MRKKREKEHVLLPDFWPFPFSLTLFIFCVSQDMDGHVGYPCISRLYLGESNRNVLLQLRNFEALAMKAETLSKLSRLDRTVEFIVSLVCLTRFLNSLLKFVETVLFFIFFSRLDFHKTCHLLYM